MKKHNDIKKIADELFNTYIAMRQAMDAWHTMEEYYNNVQPLINKYNKLSDLYNELIK